MSGFRDVAKVLAAVGARCCALRIMSQFWDLSHAAQMRATRTVTSGALSCHGGCLAVRSVETETDMKNQDYK